MNSHLIIHPDDNAAVALRQLEAGYSEDNWNFSLLQNIAVKHRFLLHPLKTGEIVRAYGVTIGKALCDLEAGALLTEHNIEHATGEVDMDINYAPKWQGPDMSAWTERTFDGYHRADGKVGTRNNWLVIPLVFCENHNLLTLREAFQNFLGLSRSAPLTDYVQRLHEAAEKGESLDDIPLELEEGGSQKLFPNIDGVRFMTHGMGCGGIQQDSDNLCKLLAGYITHGNTAGATIIGLGCQKAQFNLLMEKVNEIAPNHGRQLYFVNHQDVGRTEDLLKLASIHTYRGMSAANKLERKPAPLSKIVTGMECGGSDSFSGLSANPVIGQISDYIVSLGGSTMLSEFPELVGVEQNLISRCKDRATAEKFVGLLREFEEDAHRCGSSLSANPSPGNIRDGLITDALKSAGAAKKGGTSPVVDVQDYPGSVSQQGLTLLNTPGNDVESTTALAGAGANIILFSTGLGTPTGNPITPVIKISTNHRTAERMDDIIDFSAGGVIDGSYTIQQCADKLLEKIIAVASGELTCAEKNMSEDFLPWKRGVSL